MGFIEYRHPLRDSIFIKQESGDGPDILLLEDTEVLMQAAAPQGRNNGEVITHLLVVIFPQHHFIDDTAVDITLGLHVLSESSAPRSFPENLSPSGLADRGDIHF